MSSTASSTNDRRRIGDLRPSQLLHTFGVGATVELPNLSVMVMGLDDWPVAQGASEIYEPRLLRAVQAELGEQVTRLLTPPVAPETANTQANPFDETAQIGVPVAPFPRWLVCPYCRLLAPLQSGLFELKLDPYRKDRSRYAHHNCKKAGKAPTAIPARFLVACKNGHLDDFPWVQYVHRGLTDCKYELRLYELGASGEVADIQAQCEKCGAKRRMSDAFGEEGEKNLPACRSRWPHLRGFADGDCNEVWQRGILLGASNSWFPMMLSALALPTTVNKLGQLVEQNWGELEECESAREVKLKRKLLHGLSAYSDADIWAAVEQKKSALPGATDEPQDLREPEWQVFANPNLQLNSRDFHLRVVAPPAGYEHAIEKVVLIERLREVQALIGFTRIESPGDYSELAELPQQKRAPLGRTLPHWVPTSDVRGEGIFLHFSETALNTWLARVTELNEPFRRAHQQWRKHRGLEPEAHYPTLRYVLLHSLAHALIRQVSLECGYTTASIRERIYSRPPGEEGEPMAGVLLYTAAPDSEGTLGGLVSLGEPTLLARHLEQALESMRLCASDPLCAEHQPYAQSLHGAACHACLFLPETSCERGNRYLDRSVLVSTVEKPSFAFFAQFIEELPAVTIPVRTSSVAPAPLPRPVAPVEASLLEFCDERCHELVQVCVAQKLPLPETRFELLDDNGRVVAQAELAWPAHQLVILLPEHAHFRAAFAAQSWRVFLTTELRDPFNALPTLLSSEQRQ